jgi:hypothetical protein
MWKIPGVSVWVGLAVLWFWILLSGVGGWPLLLVITLVTLVRFSYAPKRLPVVGDTPILRIW